VEQHKRSAQGTKAVITTWLGDEVSRAARELFAEKGIRSFTSGCGSSPLHHTYPTGFWHN
jgi:hypothetical protein